MNINSTNNKLPFAVPQGYFDSLEERILKRIRSGNLISDQVNPAFALPDSYFEKLSSGILNRIALEDVSTENEEAFLEMAAPTLFQLNRTLPFNVPNSYFESLEKKTIARIINEDWNEALAEQSLYAIAGKARNPFEVPEGFFENFEARLQARIKAESVDEDLESLYFNETAPTLSNLNRSNPFAVPSNYFEQLSSNLNTGNKLAIVSEKENERKGIIRVLRPYLVISIAVAAMLVVYFGTNIIAPKKAEIQIGKLQVTNTEILELAKTDELVHFEEADLIEAAAANLDFEELALNPSSDEVSNDEIIEYLVESDVDVQHLEL